MYNLRRGRDGGLWNLEPPLHTGGGRYTSGAYDGASGRIAVTTSRIESFAALFRRISAADRAAPPAGGGDRLAPEPLFIAVRPSDSYEVRLALVERSTRLPDGGRRVTLLDVRTDEGASFVVPRFADDLGETVYVDVVAVNGSLSAASQNLAWSYGIGGPPILQRVEILIDGSTPVYAAEWSSPEMPDRVLSGDAYRDLRRRLNEERNALPDTLPNSDRLDNVVVRLRFSKPVAASEVRLGQTTLQSVGGPPRAVEWEFCASQVPIAAADREAGALGLSVRAMDADSVQLDGEPETPAALRPDGAGWIGYEDGAEGRAAGQGGDDRMHRFKLRGSTTLEPFKPYRLFTFRDAAEVASGLERYRVSGDAADPGDRATERRNSAQWARDLGDFSAPNRHAPLAAPESVISGVFLYRDAIGVSVPRKTDSGLFLFEMPFVEGPLSAQAQGAGFVAVWTAWGSHTEYGDPWRSLDATVSILACPVPAASLRAAIGRAIERGMEAAAIDGFEAASRSPGTTLGGHDEGVVYEAVAGNYLVQVRVRQGTSQGRCP